MLQDTVSYPLDERALPKYSQITAEACLINYNKLVNVVVNRWKETDKPSLAPLG